MRDFCCPNVELVEEGEVIDTYGGNFTYRDTYICKECNKVFYIDTNYMGEDFIEEDNEDEIEYLLRIHSETDEESTTSINEETVVSSKENKEPIVSFKKTDKDNLLFVGTDLNMNLHYIEIPNIFMPYKKNLEESINLVFNNNSFSNIIHPSFINNMKSRDVLHLFIEKHTLSLFNSIKTESELELIMKNEFKELFDLKENEEFEKLYQKVNKGTCITSYVTKFYKEKLLNYKARLDAIEL